MADEERKPAGTHKGWLVVGATALAGLLALKNPKVRRLLTVNDVTTGVTPEYPDLQPQIFPEPPETVFAAAVRVCETLGWRVVAEDLIDRRIHAEASVPPGFLIDFDVWLTESEDGTVVNARSHARATRADLGAAARHIRVFQRSLDHCL